MTIIAKTYWGGAPYHFRKKVEAEVEPLLLRAADFREFQGLYWTPKGSPRPKLAVVCMHPRVDFTRHYTFPRLLERGIGCLGANTRNPNNDTDTVHEEIILDVGAAVRFLKERRGVERVILIGNSGGASLNAFFQSQAKMAPAERISIAPGGLPTRLQKTELIPADGIVHISAHRGEGAVLMNVIDPSVVDELDPREIDPELDMYDPRNGFRPPPEWSRYAPEFLERFREAQVQRVRRLDRIAEAKMKLVLDAAEEMEAPDFAERPEAERREIERARYLEEVMVVYRTMANPYYVDKTLEPSARVYGSLLSHRPDLMNQRLLGFARTVTPRAWLSTWSGLSSNADLMKTMPTIEEPTLIVHAGADQEIYRESDALAIFGASAASDKTFLEFEEARHYFEPELGQKESPAVEALMNKLIPWIEERFR